MLKQAIKEQPIGHKLTLIGDKAEQVLCLPSSEYHVSSYLIEILLSRPKHFLRPEWIRDAAKSILLYEKSAYISLERLFLNNSIQRDELFFFLWHTVQTLALCEDALLESKHLILDPQFIYFTRSAVHDSKAVSFEPHFIFIPVEHKQLQPIAEPETAMLADLFEYCIDRSAKAELLLDEEISMLRQLVMGDIQRLCAWLEDKSMNPVKPKRRKVVKEKTTLQASKSSVQAIDQPKGKTITDKQKQVITISNIALLFLLNFSLSFAMKDGSLVYYGLTAVGLFILILSQLYVLNQNKKQVSVSDTRFERERRQEHLQTLESEEHWTQTEVVFEQAGQLPKKDERMQIAYLYPTNSRMAIDGETFDPSSFKKPAAVILNREFYIGADRDRCDFKPNTEQISPLHARITNQDGSFVLTDLASEAGTYLNNIRLHYYEDYLIYSGALIRFSEASFVFVIEEATK